MQTRRRFGCELETTGLGFSAIEAALVGVGLMAQAEEYNHNSRQYWKVVPDGSIQATNGGAGEVVSPPTTSLDEIRKACSALTRAGATVNQSCGLHVHFDAADLGDSSAQILEWRILLATYACAERDIDSWMIQNRRASNNNHCRSMISRVALSTLVDEAWAQPNLRGLQALYGNDRYYKVNLMAYARHGTVEFRHHFGTLSPDKVTNWVLFLEALIEHAKTVAAEIRTGTVQESDVRTRLRSGLWYQSDIPQAGVPRPYGNNTVRLFSALERFYPHAVAAAAAAREAAPVPRDWRASLNPVGFEPIRVVTRDASGARARALEMMMLGEKIPGRTSRARGRHVCRQRHGHLRALEQRAA